MRLSKFLLAAAALFVSAGGALAQFELTILHTNDFHSRFEPISRFDSGCSAEDNTDGRCFGGYARLVTAVTEARERAENSILVDGGDQFQGSLFYTYYKGAFAAEMMNDLGYDGMTVGNHEFDDGPEVLRGFMDSVSFPVLMSNADVSGEPQLHNALRKSTLISAGGEYIGLIGLTPQDTDEISSPGDNVVFSDPSAAVQAEVDRLTGMGVNKIIVLSHSGYATDIAVAEGTSGVDVIVGGHTNTYLNSSDPRAAGPYPTFVNGTAIVQAYAFGKYLGELNVTFDDEGEVTRASGEPLLIDGNVVENAATVARVTEMAAPLEEIRNRIVATSGASIEGNRSVCRHMECEMGNLVADAMLDRVRDQGIVIAFQNGGGLRASIDAGEVTMGEVYTVLPFQNTLATFQVTGATILEALENGMRQFDDPSRDGRFPQVSGMRYTFDPAQEFGARISDVTVDEGNGYVPLDPSKVYGLVSNNFVRGGGDGYRMFRGAMNVYDFGPNLADVLADYLAENTDYEPYVDGRITQAM